MRINPHGMYARAIEETDYIVPRGGYFFEVKAVAAVAAAILHTQHLHLRVEACGVEACGTQGCAAYTPSLLC